MSNNINTITFNFFSDILNKQSSALQAVHACDGNITFHGEVLVFDLPSLHELLFPVQRTSYKAFRQMLYSGSLNQDLQALGAKVAIFESSGKVDGSQYCLVPAGQ